MLQPAFLMCHADKLMDRQFVAVVSAVLSGSCKVAICAKTKLQVVLGRSHSTTHFSCPCGFSLSLLAVTLPAFCVVC